MNKIAIRVDKLGKKYRMGQREPYKTFRDAILNAASLPVKRFKSRINSNDEDGSAQYFWALKDVSFEVEQGDVIGVIGRNGAGKSTLLKILSRITSPTEGMIELNGRVGSLLEVGTGFHPELTGRENIFLSGSILGMRRREIEDKLDAIINFAEIEKFIETPVKRYSSGMYVRLAFAVAAHLDSDILLVDEVLAVGDYAFQKKCLGKMGNIAKEGRTVLFVSHNMGAVSSLCRSGIVLAEGSIQLIGDVDKVIASYIQSCETRIYSESLIDHPNRGRGFRQLLTSFVLETDNGVAYYGAPLTFRIGYNFKEKISVPQFVASFHNASAITAFTLNSDFQSNDIPSSLYGEGEVVCKIHFLPLLPGNYFVNVRLWQIGQKLDEIENVASFQVEWLKRDVGQFNWDSSTGVVYVDANWYLQ